MKHPQTFRSTSNNKPLKLKEGIAYENGLFLLSNRWGHYYLTYQGHSVTIPYTTYRYLINGKDIAYKEGIFLFHAGFEESKEGKLLLRNHNTIYIPQVIEKVQDLFETGLVTSYVTEWWRYLV
jgi:hypothetical protein